LFALEEAMSARSNTEEQTTGSRMHQPLRWAHSRQHSGSDRRAGFTRRLLSERGTSLLETALTLPLLLLVSVSISGFGRAYQTWQVLTNAAREGARVAVLPNEKPSDVQSRVLAYMQAGQLPNANQATITVNQNATISIGAAQTAAASIVTV